MAQFLVAGYLPDDFDPSTMDEAMGRAIHALNKEMEDAGATKSLQAQTDASAFAIASPERMRYSPAALRGGVASIFENKQIAIGKWRKWQLAKP